MAQQPFRDLDWRKWFDRMLPQTLQIALWLLYIDGVMALLGYIDRTGEFGWSRLNGGIPGIVAPLAIVSFGLGGLLIANGRRLGWHIAVAASVSPFVLRLLIKVTQFENLTLRWVLTQDSLVSFLFEAALVALLLHPMSRTHARRWLR